MEDKIETLEDLAVLIQNTMASKEDIQEVKADIKGINTQLEGINSRLDGIDSRRDNLDARVGRIEADVHGLRDEMVHRQEFENALDRVKYLEKSWALRAASNARHPS
jgi:archaellum component FlaC